MEALELAKSITEFPLTIKATLTGIRRLRAATPLPDDHDLITMCFNGADFKEGVSAFFEKRQPTGQAAKHCFLSSSPRTFGLRSAQDQLMVFGIPYIEFLLL